MEWKELSVRDRANFIHQFVKGGIITIKEQEKFYNSSISHFTMTNQFPIKPLTAKAY